MRIHWNTLKQMQHEFEQKLGKNNPKTSTNKSFEFGVMFWAILSVNTIGYWFSFKRIIWFWRYFPQEPGVFGLSRFREICFENCRDLLITNLCSPTICQTIDLFSLYVLFSQYRPRDALQGISLIFFIYYAYPRTGCTRIRRHLQETVLWGTNHVVWNGKTKHTR